MTEPLAHLCDAAINFALIIALLIGVEVKWILLIMLIGMFVGEIFKAFNAFVGPIVKSLKAK